MAWHLGGISATRFEITEEVDRVKLKDKLRLMGEIEKRNQARIKAFTCKPRKSPSSGFEKKTEGNRVTPEKPK